MSVYEHEAIRQLAKELGLPEITSNDLSEKEIERFLAAIATEEMNPYHYTPAQCVSAFFMFLRETGRLKESTTDFNGFDTPRKVVSKIIYRCF